MSPHGVVAFLKKASSKDQVLTVFKRFRHQEGVKTVKAPQDTDRPNPLKRRETKLGDAGMLQVVCAGSAWKEEMVLVVIFGFDLVGDLVPNDSVTPETSSLQVMLALCLVLAHNDEVQLKSVKHG